MGYAFCTGFCFGCKKIFTFNPMRVPSIPINGIREPVCLECITRANPARIKNGLEPIVPLPGAYESCEEEELGSDAQEITVRYLNRWSS
jgi:hypothetical protein